MRFWAWLRGFLLHRRLLHRLWREQIYYINGAEVLPPPLSAQEERDALARLEAGDEQARDLLITHNLRLVVYIARKF